MNIDLLSKMVLELIIEHDKVVLPFFGVFTAEVVPSSFSDKGYTLNPPYRRLHFRASSQSDNVLAEFYANANSVDLDTAFKIVSEFTKELRNVLLTSKVLVFPGLGRIRTTKENNFFFVADEDLDIYPEGFGLKPISLKAHRAESMNNQKVEVFDNNETVSGKEQTDVIVEGLDGVDGVGVDDGVGVVDDVVDDDVNVDVDDVVDDVVDGGGIDDMGDTSRDTSGDATADVAITDAGCIGEEVADLGGENAIDDANASGIVEIEENRVESESGQSVLDGEMPDEANASAEAEAVKQFGVAKADGSGHRGLKMTIAVILGIIALVGLFLLVFLLLSELCPAFMDSLLYTEEELEILNYKY